jgi:hypothetical protein
MAPPESVETQRKLFTLEEANKTLPLVKMIVADIVRQFGVVEDLSRRLDSLDSSPKRRAKDQDPYSEELGRTRAELETETAKLKEYMEELEKLGVELKGTDGLCDFPSMRDGRMVYLCWRLGEPEIAYWHELHTGFGGRRPLRPQVATQPRGPSSS